ncbi:MAG: O-antigen ligase family protein [Calditrichota bacterium]
MLLAFVLPISIAATNIALVLNVLLLLRRALVDKDCRECLAGGITTPLLVYLAFDLTATLFSGYPVHLKSFFEDKWVTAGYFVALGLAVNSRTAERAFQALFAGGVIAAGYALVQFFTGWDIVRGQPLEACGGGFMALGFFNHHLTYGGSALVIALTAWAWVIYSPGGYLFNSKTTPKFPAWLKFLSGFKPGEARRNLTGYGLSALETRQERFSSFYRWIRVSNLIAAILLLGGVFVSYARSAILGLGAGLTIMILTAPRKLKRYLTVGVVAGAIILILAVPGLLDRFGRILQGEDNENPRLLLWQTSWHIIRDHPWFGVGQGNWNDAFEKFKVPGEYISTAHPHNDILSTAVDGGLIALICFLWIWVTLFRKGWQNLRDPALTADRRRRIIAGLMAAAGILTAGLAQNYLSDAEVGSLVWFVLGLSLAGEKSKPAVN